jgi:hypothetical protein
MRPHGSIRVIRVIRVAVVSASDPCGTPPQPILYP